MTERKFGQMIQILLMTESLAKWSQNLPMTERNFGQIIKIFIDDRKFGQMNKIFSEIWQEIWPND